MTQHRVSSRVEHDDPFSPFDETPSGGPGARSCTAPADALMVAPVPGEFRHRLGLHRVEVSDWIVVDGDHQPTLAMKEHLLATRRDEVFAALPGTEAAGEELAELVEAHLRRRSPHGAGTGARRRPVCTGSIAPGGWWPTTSACSTSRDGELVLVGASLCSPNRWLLEDKLGRTMDVVHGPVPYYERHIARPVDDALARLTEARLVTRANWGVADHPALFQPVVNRHPIAFESAEEAARGLWLRVERQTLRRLPESGAIVFTIRTYQQRLSDYLGPPGRPRRLPAGDRPTAPGGGVLQRRDPLPRHLRTM